MSELQVPLILQDLRKEETMVHIMRSLNQLSQVSETIFKKIENKCEEFQGRLHGIDKVN